ncbi:PadR family transcriptional regulator [bacterium]|nr:PadR family transcriptional regulator [bacterium]
MSKVDVLQGTLDLLILRTVQLEPLHGYGIAQRLEQITRGTFQVNGGSLFPALYALEKNGYLRSEWRATENNRRAKYYALTPGGRHKLTEEKRHWARIVAAMQLVLDVSK